jgi:tetraacyldisaccharide 4'-kinase
VQVNADHTAKQVGDEPLLLSRTAPTIVARNRVKGAALAVKSGASVIVMDDGFQNASLIKDFSLLVIDGERGLGNERVFPAGPLRVSLPLQIAACDAIAVVGLMSKDTDRALKGARSKSIPILAAQLVPDISTAARMRGLPALAYAGIGHPQKFYATLTAAGVDVRKTKDFPDHHIMSAAEAADLMSIAGRERLYLITTEKDMSRMRGDPALQRLAKVTTAFPVNMTFDMEERVERDVIDRFLWVARHPRR